MDIDGCFDDSECDIDEGGAPPEDGLRGVDDAAGPSSVRTDHLGALLQRLDPRLWSALAQPHHVRRTGND